METNSPFQGDTLNNEGNNSEILVDNQDNIINQEDFTESQAIPMKNLFMIISIFSWVLLLITGWLFLAITKIENVKLFWIYFIFTTNDIIDDFPLTIYYVVFFMISIGTLLCITTALFVYLYSLFIKKDFLVIRGMLGNFSKFHFIPLACVSALFIIGETVDKEENLKGVQYFFTLIFTFIALGSLIFIYIQTRLEKPLYAAWAIKHGVYSCLIALLIHNIGYTITAYRTYIEIIVKNKYEEDKDIYEHLFKGCYIFFSVVINLGNLSTAFFLKEIVIASINLLINFGMALQFYKIDEELKEMYGKVPGIIDTIMIPLSAIIIFLIFYLK